LQTKCTQHVTFGISEIAKMKCSIEHYVADKQNLIANDPLTCQVLDCSLCRGKKQVGGMICENAIDFLRHFAIKRS
jgi:hypothetical protein